MISIVIVVPLLLGVGGPLRRGELRTMLLREALVKPHGVQLIEIQDEIEGCLVERGVASMLRRDRRARCSGSAGSSSPPAATL